MTNPTEKIRRIEKEIKKCKECCYVRDMTNIKPPICNYHQGYFKGREEREKEILEIIDKVFNIEVLDGKLFTSDAVIIVLKNIEHKLKSQIQTKEGK
ncbi:MAG TPA: hypothetical protein VGB37_12780 [Candidatus Lokiarchaeia archaeon]